MVKVSNRSFLESWDKFQHPRDKDGKFSKVVTKGAAVGALATIPLVTAGEEVTGVNG